MGGKPVCIGKIKCSALLAHFRYTKVCFHEKLVVPGSGRTGDKKRYDPTSFSGCEGELDSLQTSTAQSGLIYSSNSFGDTGKEESGRALKPGPERFAG